MSSTATQLSPPFKEIPTKTTDSQKSTSQLAPTPTPLTLFLKPFQPPEPQPQLKTETLSLLKTLP